MTPIPPAPRTPSTRYFPATMLPGPSGTPCMTRAFIAARSAARVGRKVGGLGVAGPSAQGALRRSCADPDLPGKRDGPAVTEDAVRRPAIVVHARARPAGGRRLVPGADAGAR